MDKKNNEDKSGSSGIALGLCLGLAMGTAVGAATKNLGIWMPAGMTLGLALGTTFDQRKGSGGDGEENGAGDETDPGSDENERKES